MEHKDIAKLAYSILVDDAPDLANQHWWAQNIAIAYEQHVGIRIPGQSCDGDFQVSVSKTVQGTLDEALAKMVALMDDVVELDGVPLEAPPSSSGTEKWRYWRCSFTDGGRVNVSIYAKSPEKCSLSLQHSKLGTKEDTERWRAVWKEQLSRL